MYLYGADLEAQSSFSSPPRSSLRQSISLWICTLASTKLLLHNTSEKDRTEKYSAAGEVLVQLETWTWPGDIPLDRPGATLQMHGIQ